MTLKIFLLGYHGFSNCGADARLSVIIETIRQINDDCEITYGTIDPHIEVHDAKKIIWNVYNCFYRLFWPIVKSDVVIVEEGGPFMDFCGSSYLFFFLTNIFYAKLFKKKIVLYSVGIERLKKLDWLLTRSVLYKVNLITARTKKAYNRFRHMGLHCPLYHTTDCAVGLKTSPRHKDEKGKKTIGFCFKDEFGFPVTFKLFGKNEDRYHGNFFFTYSKSAKKKMEIFCCAMAGTIEKLAAEGYHIAILNFEPKIDTRISEQIIRAVANTKTLEYYSALDYNPCEMKSIISNLDVLVSCRVHPIILSLERPVPIIGIHHNDKMTNLFNELCLEDFLIQFDDKNMEVRLLEKMDNIMKNRKLLLKSLRKKYNEFIRLDHEQVLMLKEILADAAKK